MVATEAEFDGIAQRRELDHGHQRARNDPHLKNSQPHIIVTLDGEDATHRALGELVEGRCASTIQTT